MKGYASRLDLEDVIKIMASGLQPIRERDYSYFADVAGCDISTLRRRLREHKPRIIRSKKQYTGWINPDNKELRREYGERYKDETIEDFWCFVHWTDEAHLDSTISKREFIFRAEGNTEDPANLQEVP